MSTVKPTLSRRTAAVAAQLDAMPGASAAPVKPGRAAIPLAVMYKVMGKLFAILSVRGDEFVILKCDPDLADLLRSRYRGTGHRAPTT